MNATTTVESSPAAADHHVALVVIDPAYPGVVGLAIEHRDPQIVNGEFVSAPVSEDVIVGQFNPDSADTELARRGLVRSEAWEVAGAFLIAEVVPTNEVIFP